MTTISKITVQKKARQRYNIFLKEAESERYAFSVDEDILIKYNLRKGQALEEEEMRALIDADEAKKTQHLAIHYLSYRIRSAHELRTYLQKKEREPAHIEQTMAFLFREKLLNDEEFAGAYIRTKTRQHVVGPRKLSQELVQKGISSSIIAQALMPLTFEWQVESAYGWLEKQLSKQRKQKESWEKQKLKWMNRLVSKGFEHEPIREALSMIKGKDEEVEWKALVYQADKLAFSYRKKYEEREVKWKLKQALYRKGFALNVIERYLDEYPKEGD
ncbi:recombination regulator RecX [Shouchella shacheensis]|uniref:recombination regulator RecX n=1 Tax=Shouchella shacheensis TaxID=1649580 RepID=UPI000AB4D991|nr:recombination regulator RecX [Shouchella shacheensis]